jgi:hypothetical protein
LTAIAAFVSSGEWIDEIRPSDEEARSAWLARAVPLVVQRRRGGFGLGDHSAAEFLRGSLGPEQTYGANEVAQAFTRSVRRKQVAAGATPRLVAIELSGPVNAVASVARQPFAAGLRPLSGRGPNLASLPGATEIERFDSMQAIERDIWLLNGGNRNPTGTLPAEARR